MKICKCPGCHEWRVLVKVQRCGCGKNHTKIAQTSKCPLPNVQQVFRRHGTCRRTPPQGIRHLEESSV